MGLVTWWSWYTNRAGTLWDCYTGGAVTLVSMIHRCGCYTDEAGILVDLV